MGPLCDPKGTSRTPAFLRSSSPQYARRIRNEYGVMSCIARECDNPQAHKSMEMNFRDRARTRAGARYGRSTYIYTTIYIYIYMERERERERDIGCNDIERGRESESCIYECRCRCARAPQRANESMQCKQRWISSHVPSGGWPAHPDSPDSIPRKTPPPGDDRGGVGERKGSR